MEKRRLCKRGDSPTTASAAVAMKIHLTKCKNTRRRATWNDLMAEEKTHVLSPNITQWRRGHFATVF